MWNGLPEIGPGSNRDAKDKQKKNKETSPKLNYKGITLKEYFRMCEQNRPTNTLKQIKEESRASSRSSKAETPSFNQQDQQQQVRGKFKTETCQVQNENHFRINTLKCGQSKGNMNSLQKGQKGNYIAIKKNEDRKKIFSKIHCHSTKEHNDIMNRSTLNSFYQIEQNKKKMLKKLQQEKNRSNQLRLSDAFFITKYGSKFKIDCKAVNQE